MNKKKRRNSNKVALLKTKIYNETKRRRKKPNTSNENVSIINEFLFFRLNVCAVFFIFCQKYIKYIFVIKRFLRAYHFKQYIYDITHSVIAAYSVCVRVDGIICVCVFFYCMCLCVSVIQNYWSERYQKCVFVCLY